MIAILDYGAGNLRSVAKAFEAVGTVPIVTNNPAAQRFITRDQPRKEGSHGRLAGRKML